MSLIAPLKNPVVWRQPSVLFLVLANLIPLVGVVVFGWQVFPIMFLFWFENAVVGFFNVLKMLFASGPGSPFGVKLFLIPFFILHYGIFTLVHGAFVGIIFGGNWRGGVGPGPDFRELIETLSQSNLWLAILGLVASHGFSFVTNYLANGALRTTSVIALMVQPYGRVVVLHLAIMGSGFLLVLMGAPKVGLVFLVALKIGLDVLAHAKLHQLEKRTTDV